MAYWHNIKAVTMMSSNNIPSFSMGKQPKKEPGISHNTDFSVQEILDAVANHKDNVECAKSMILQDLILRSSEMLMLMSGDTEEFTDHLLSMAEICERDDIAEIIPAYELEMFKEYTYFLQDIRECMDTMSGKVENMIGNLTAIALRNNKRLDDYEGNGFTKSIERVVSDFGQKKNDGTMQKLSQIMQKGANRKKRRNGP